MSAVAKFSPLSASERFTALQGASVDLLARITTWTMSRDTTLGLNFAAINYFDGQGFLVRRADGFTSAADLNGGSICVQTGTTTELNVTDFFAANNMTFNPVVFERIDEAYAVEKRIQGWSRAKRQALIDGRTDLLSGLASRSWAARRARGQA